MPHSEEALGLGAVFSREDFLKLSSSLATKALSILREKAVYSRQEDALESVKIEAEICRLMGLSYSNPAHRCLGEILKKIRRIIRLCDSPESSGSGVVDSLEDSLVDIINYAILCAGIISEKGRFSGLSAGGGREAVSQAVRPVEHGKTRENGVGRPSPGSISAARRRKGGES